MKKEINRDFVISGIHIGEHGFSVDGMMEEIDTRALQAGMDFVTLRIGALDYRKERELVSEEQLIKWARYLADNKVYFIFLYSIQQAPKGRESILSREVVAQIKAIAGEYFLGDTLGEVGSHYCGWHGYFTVEKMPAQNLPDMQAAKDNYLKVFRRYVEIEKRLGIENISTVEATVLNSYNLEAGATLPMLETMCGDPEISISFLRGAARAYGAKHWGTYIANEWYGGLRNEDTLKRKRLERIYSYVYLAGSNAVCLESGDEAIASYGTALPYESELCRHYRDTAAAFAQYIKQDARPVGGPKVKVAFVQGNLDGWGCWGGSSVWSQFGDEKWGHGDAEHSWRILKEIGKKRSWCEVENYGDEDTSAAPAYGQYDVIPASAPLEVMQSYEHLIFVGWNTMTEELYGKLERYVETGGHLLMGAAHLNTTARRDGELAYIRNGEVSRLFGCRVLKSRFKANDGYKFMTDSLNEKLKYPYSKDLMCDPILASGYASYANIRLRGGTVVARLCDEFMPGSCGEATVVENKLGAGTATLLTSCDPVGNNGVYPLYRALVREILSSTARNADVKVLAGDSVRFAVYEGGKVYLLNTDYDIPAAARISWGEREMTVMLEAGELKAVETDA